MSKVGKFVCACMRKYLLKDVNLLNEFCRIKLSSTFNFKMVLGSLKDLLGQLRFWLSDHPQDIFIVQADFVGWY
jgi:hypothetical protein